MYTTQRLYGFEREFLGSTDKLNYICYPLDKTIVNYPVWGSWESKREWPSSRPTFVVIGLFEEKKMIGFIVLDNLMIQNRAEMKAFYLEEGHQNQRAGVLLLQAAEKSLLNDLALYCKKEEIINYQIEAPFYVKAKYGSFLEHIFLQSGWNVVEWFWDIFFTDDFPWLDSPHKIFGEFEIFPWKNLNQLQRAAVFTRIKNDPSFFVFNPFFYGEKTEFLNSLGVLHKGEVIGWVMTCRFDAETIYYGPIFIYEEWQRSGILMDTLIQSIKIHREHRKEIPYGLFTIHMKYSQTQKTWTKKLAEKRFLPYCSEFRVAKAGIKPISL